jgi:hypothetical protein
LEPAQSPAVDANEKGPESRDPGPLGKSAEGTGVTREVAARDDR